jgi:hypothetical protein
MMFSACFWFLTVTSVIETAGNRMSRAAFKTHHGDAGKNQGHRVIGKGKPFAADYADECRSKIQPLIFTDDTDLNWEIARDRTTSPTSGKRHRPSASTRRFSGVHFDLRL